MKTLFCVRNDPVDQAPKKQIIAKLLISIIALYSARKNSAKPIAAYSTLYPLTNSLSASGRSNGARFVSARILTRNNKKEGNKGIAKKIKF
jgi:hypothetical protein